MIGSTHLNTNEKRTKSARIPIFSRVRFQCCFPTNDMKLTGRSVIKFSTACVWIALRFHPRKNARKQHVICHLRNYHVYLTISTVSHQMT